jgi:stage II sporulation protein M
MSDSGNSLRSEGFFSSLSSFQREFLRYFSISLIIFVAGCVGGFLTARADPVFGETLLTLFQDLVSNEIMADDPPYLALQLFLNNLQACVLLFIGGAAFGIVTLFVLSFNGIVIGGIMEVVGGKTGGLVMLAAIIPHGIFEIPVVLVSSALGMMLGRAVVLEFIGQGDASLQAMKLGTIFVKYIIPFIAFAACVEAFITPAVLQLMT